MIEQLKARMALLSDLPAGDAPKEPHPFTDSVDQRFWTFDPLASVCILTYNHELYLRETLESVLNQECAFPFEIIIGEDCSTDETLSLCLDYQQRYPGLIRILHSEVNVGLIPNFERVMRAARGKYVAICGGDDYWLSREKLSRQVRFLENHPAYGMTGCSSSIYALESSGEVTFYKQMFSLYLPASSFCMRKALLMEYLDTIAPIFAQEKAEDLPLRLWLSLVSKIYGHAECMVYYRELPESVSHSSDTKKRTAFWLSVTRMRVAFHPFLPSFLRWGACLKIMYAFWSSRELREDNEASRFYRRMAQGCFPLPVRMQEPFVRLLIALHPSLAYYYVAAVVRPLRWWYERGEVSVSVSKLGEECANAGMRECGNAERYGVR